MIKNLEATADAISNWIAEKMRSAGAKTAVFGLSGGVDSALVALLCKRAGVPCMGVLMPCQSSPSSVQRAQELAQKHSIPTVKVQLDGAFEVIRSQVLFQGSFNSGNSSDGALRSCLRAPTLDYVGKLTNGLIIGTGNRDEDEMTRYYQKRGDGCVDISPIAALHKSEVYQIAEFLGCTEAILKAVPSADLWGPNSGQEDEKELGLSYSEVEWGIREFESSLNQPRHANAPLPLPEGEYNERQDHVLRKLQAMEFFSRHKASAPPVFDVRSLPGLVD